MNKLHIFKHIKFWLPVCMLPFILIMSCEHADPVQPEQLQATFDNIQSEIFNLNCAVSGCHLGASAPLGLDLSEGNAYGNLANVPSVEINSLDRVEPGDPENSYLVWKIEGRQGIQGERMPRGRDPLSQEQINTIREWIANGALPVGSAPVVSNIADQIIERGASFSSFDLDDFVTDTDHQDSEITWTIDWSERADTVFSTTVDTGHVVTIEIVDSTFVGSETFTFTATDPDGNSDSDSARFTIVPPQVTFTLIQQTILTPNCAVSGCHLGPNANPPVKPMDLSAGNAYGNLVGVASGQMPALNRVEPGDPDNSYLVWKIEGRQGISGQRMPFGGPYLSQEEINRIIQWIDDGAPDN